MRFLLKWIAYLVVVAVGVALGVAADRLLALFISANSLLVSTVILVYVAGKILLFVLLPGSKAQVTRLLFEKDAGARARQTAAAETPFDMTDVDAALGVWWVQILWALAHMFGKYDPTVARQIMMQPARPAPPVQAAQAGGQNVRAPAPAAQTGGQAVRAAAPTPGGPGEAAAATNLQPPAALQQHQGGHNGGGQGGGNQGHGRVAAAPQPAPQPAPAQTPPHRERSWTDIILGRH